MIFRAPLGGALLGGALLGGVLLVAPAALCSSPEDPAEFTLFLIGDAGEPAPGGEPVLRALGAELARSPESTWVVFLGDNVYPRGLPEPGDPDRADMEARIAPQVDVVVKSDARGIFIPGNHDWYGPGPEGAAVRRQEAWVEARGAGRVEWLPDNACPGPVVLDRLHAALRLVVLDTEWWFEDSRPQGPESGCPCGSEAETQAAIASALETARDRAVIVVGHHPLVSRGVHGGHFDFVDHVFPVRAWKPWAWLPLPVIGSLYPTARRSGIHSQDMSSETYGRFRESLAEAFTAHPPLVYASGHEHNLQILDGRGARFQIVSGAGIFGHALPVDQDDARFAAREAGFMSLEKHADNWVVTVFVVDASGAARRAHAEVLEMDRSR